MSRRSGRGIQPDTALELKLDAIARRHNHQDTPRDEAVADLKRVADGRADLLAIAAGTVLGGYLGEPGMSHPGDVYAASLLILAGADPDKIVAHVDDVRRAVEAPRYGTS